MKRVGLCLWFTMGAFHRLSQTVKLIGDHRFGIKVDWGWRALHLYPLRTGGAFVFSRHSSREDGQSVA